MTHRIEPRLVAVNGVMSGEVFPLFAHDVSLGRDASSTICIPDPALSRRHCAFTMADGQWQVSDQGSANGTFVNGVQVATRPLLDGDHVTAGGTVLLFVAAVQEQAAELVEGDVGAPTRRLRLDDDIYFNSPAVQSGRQGLEPGLRTLLRISTVIGQVRSEEALHRELVALLREVLRAETASVVLTGAEGRLDIVACSGAAASRARVNRDLVSRVLAEGTGVLYSTFGEEGSAAARAEAPAEGGSLLCVPVSVRDITVGALYLECGEGRRFDEDDLQLLTALAPIAAIALDNVRHIDDLRREAEQLRGDRQLDHSLVGVSAAMDTVCKLIGRVAPTDSTVLVVGETGTGKELVARAIHRNSPRATKPFIAINCAALTESLLESELFGHERGAFSGAISQKRGRIEAADGGTLFLDEIGEMAASMQSKLLRVLQHRELERVGGTRTIKVNIRLVAATNRDLPAEVRAGRFREDLYFRLNVVSIAMPPLRERPDDIEALARHFLSRSRVKARRRLSRISEAALACLRAYEWPGNVRELENAIERAAVLGSTDEILPDDLPENVVEGANARQARLSGDGYHDAVLDAKKRAIVEAFRATGGNYTETARALGIHPNYLHRLVRDLKLRPVLTNLL